MISRENRVIATGIVLALPAGVVTQVLLDLVGATGGTSSTVASAVVVVVGVVLPQIIIHRHDGQPDSTADRSGP